MSDEDGHMPVLRDSLLIKMGQIRCGSSNIVCPKSPSWPISFGQACGLLSVQRCVLHGPGPWRPGAQGTYHRDADRASGVGQSIDLSFVIYRADKNIFALGHLSPGFRSQCCVHPRENKKWEYPARH